jgi:hypothetical protein
MTSLGQTGCPQKSRPSFSALTRSLNKSMPRLCFTLLHLKQIAKTAASGISATESVLEPAGKALNDPTKNLQIVYKLRPGGAGTLLPYFDLNSFFC